MHIELLTIGDEILSGDILNTNTKYLSEELWGRGYRVEYHTSVRDDETAIADALLRAAARADIILCTGGLGPTADDFTIEVAAKTFGVALKSDQGTIDYLEKLFAKRGRSLSENNRKQALIPEGGRALQNLKGTAPGVYFCFHKRHFYFMPGVPSEMKYIFAAHLLPDLERINPLKLKFVTKYLKTFGCPESELDNKLKDLMSGRSEIGNVRIGFRAHMPEVVVKASAWNENQSIAQTELDSVVKQIYARIGEFVYSENPEDTLEAVFVKKLTQVNKTFAVAESCTGGRIADRITNISGASEIFLGGVTCYSNEFKKNLLHVSDEILKTHGAVSSECAEALVRGIQKITGADYCAAVTGIAGPGGGSEDKPVGTVHVATLCDGELENKKYLLPFERKIFKEIVASVVMKRIIDRINSL